MSLFKTIITRPLHKKEPAYRMHADILKYGKISQNKFHRIFIK